MSREGRPPYETGRYPYAGRASRDGLEAYRSGVALELGAADASLGGPVVVDTASVRLEGGAAADPRAAHEGSAVRQPP